MPIRAARTLRRHRPPRAAATPRVLARRRRGIAARAGRTRKLPARSSHPRSRRGTPRPALASRYAVAPPGALERPRQDQRHRPRRMQQRLQHALQAPVASPAQRSPRARRSATSSSGWAPATRARRPPGSGCAGPAPAPRCYPAAGRSLPGAAGCPGDNAAGRRRRTGEVHASGMDQQQPRRQLEHARLAFAAPAIELHVQRSQDLPRRLRFRPTLGVQA